MRSTSEIFIFVFRLDFRFPSYTLHHSSKQIVISSPFTWAEEYCNIFAVLTGVCRLKIAEQPRKNAEEKHLRFLRNSINGLSSSYRVEPAANGIKSKTNTFYIQRIFFIFLTSTVFSFALFYLTDKMSQKEFPEIF